MSLHKLKQNYKEIVKVYESTNEHASFESSINKMIQEGWKVKTISTSTALSTTETAYSSYKYYKTICVVCFYNYDFIDLTKKKKE